MLRAVHHSPPNPTQLNKVLVAFQVLAVNCLTSQLLPHR